MLIALGASCTVMEGNREPVHRVGSLRDPLRPIYHSVYLLEEPKDLRDEFSYPPTGIRQIFAWGAFGNEWRVVLNQTGYASAGFKVRRPTEVASRLSDLMLSFQMKPAAMARCLAIGLSTTSSEGRYLLISKPIAEYKVWQEPVWGHYRLDLEDFRSQGVLVDLEGHSVRESAPDLKDISEIRLVKLAETSLNEPVVIRNIRLRPTTWVLR